MTASRKLGLERNTLNQHCVSLIVFMTSLKFFLTRIPLNAIIKLHRSCLHKLNMNCKPCGHLSKIAPYINACFSLTTIILSKHIKQRAIDDEY